MRTRTVLAAILLVTTLPGIGADHIGGMSLSVSSEGLAATLAWTITGSGMPTGGTIDWTTGDGAGGSVHDGFTDGVYSGNASGSGTLNDGRPFAWTRTGPSPVVVSVTYSYVADGIYTVTWSDCCPQASGQADLVVSVDGRPQTLSAGRGPGVGEITLSWRAPSQTGLSGYRLLRGPSEAGLAPAGDLPAGGESHVVGGLADGTTYVFALRALYGAAEGGTSNAASATTPGAPTAARDLVARSGPSRGEIQLAWTAPVDDGGRPLSGYRVYRGHHPDQLAFLADVPQAALVDGPLPDGITRYYRVAALNDRGEGPSSNLAGAATFPPTAPPAPLPTPRAFSAAAHAGVQSHIFGGIDQNGASLATIVAFDPYDNTMTTLSAQLPSARHGAGAAWVPEAHVHADEPRALYCDPVCVRGLSLVAGGRAQDLAGQSAALAADPGTEVLAFDPSAGTVTPVATLPSARSHAAVAYAAGALVVAGGRSASGSPLDEIVHVDAGSFAVAVPARLPAAVEGAAAAGDGRVVYLLGGLATDGPTDAILRYDPVAATVQDTGARLPVPLAHATAVWAEGAVLLFGGSTAGGPTDAIVRYDPATGSVASAGRLPSARCCGSAVFDGQHAYVFGGTTGQGNTGEVVRHRPGAPIGVTAEGGPIFGAITVRWLPPAGPLAPTGYRIYRAAAGGTFALLAEVGPAAASHLDAGHPDGTSFEYRVSAVVDADEGAHSAAVRATTWLPTVPGVVRNLTWSYSLGFADVRWDAPADNGAQPPTGYVVTRYRMEPVSGDYYAEETVDVGNNRGYRDQVRLISLYRWVVSAYNDVGRGTGVVSEDVPDNRPPDLSELIP